MLEKTARTSISAAAVAVLWHKPVVTICPALIRAAASPPGALFFRVTSYRSTTSLRQDPFDPDNFRYPTAVP
jgi:hypothetical protein